MTLSKTLFTGRQPTLKFQCEQCGVKVEEEAATQSTQFLYKAIWMPQTSIVLVSINNEDVVRSLTNNFKCCHQSDGFYNLCGCGFTPLDVCPPY